MSRIRLTYFVRIIPVLFVILPVLTGCTSNPEPNVEAYAEGRLTIRDQPDSTQDFSDFEVLLASQIDGNVDTLGYAVTEMDGSFGMNITAEAEGVYPLIISRMGAVFTVEEFVIVAGDTSQISGQFPLMGHRLRVVSPENAAWAAYRNAKFQHNESLVGFIENQAATLENMETVVRRTSTVLWSLQSVYPRAMASDLAAVEAVMMLEGWDDSLVVARLLDLDEDNSTLANAVKAARRSTARLSGLDSSLALISHYMSREKDANVRAELQAELVAAYVDSSVHDMALSEALSLRRTYPDTEWAAWASQAIYELENLLPGMVGPTFSLTTMTGDAISSESLLGRYVILEFFEPTSESFLKELSYRNTVFSSLDSDLFATVSISLETDADINNALFEEGAPPGQFVFADGGRDSDVAVLFNIQQVPTRYLMSPNGVILGKYHGSGMPKLVEDVTAIYEREQLSSTPGSS